MIAVLAGVGVFCAVLAVRPRRIDLSTYLGSTDPRPKRRHSAFQVRPALIGSAAGALAAVTTAPDRLLALSAIGAAAGVLARRAARSTRAQHRAARLVQELPTVADTLALHVLAGESVAMALTRFTSVARGVAADELRSTLGLAAAGLEDALRHASANTCHPEAARLYDLLGHAHRTGGRLAEALAELAVDYRAGIARELMAEGGRRALAVYGPILALMIPVTLLFLMYPTLAGLSALSSTP